MNSDRRRDLNGVGTIRPEQIGAAIPGQGAAATSAGAPMIGPGPLATA